MEQLPVIVSLDTVSRNKALAIAQSLSGRVWGYKVHRLIDRHGPEIVHMLKKFGKVFVDMKLADTPDTVRGRIKEWAAHNADLISVQGNLGADVLKAASSAGRDRAVAITQLTSDTDSSEVLRRARDAYQSGIRVVTCSAWEAAAVKTAHPSALIITPGIRAAGTPRHDQKRTATPAEAIREGADLLVIGRPITNAADPAAALEVLMQDVSVQ